MRVLVSSTAVTVLVACSVSSPAPGPSSSRAAAPGPSEPAVEAAPDPTPSNGACAWEPGQTTVTVTVDDTPRRFIRWVGPDAGAEAPVVFGWHGFGSRPEWILRGLDVDTQWRDAIVIAPYGEGRSFEQFGDAVQPGWQVAKGELEDRDLKLFDAILGQLRETGCGDLNRVYSTGFSNGGFFSNVLACHRADDIAAAAPTGGGGPFQPGCGQPPAVLITHGRADDVVQYAMAEHTWSTWLKQAQCSDAPGPEGVACVLASGCKDEAQIEFCAFDGKHEWPAGHAAKIATFLRGHTRKG